MKELYAKGLAIRGGPESCVVVREGGVEALTGVRAGWAYAVAQRLGSKAALGDVLTVVALTGSDGPAIARLRPTTRHLGLSLADRGCLALAQRLELPVVTTDRAWVQLQIGVEIRLARP